MKKRILALGLAMTAFSMPMNSIAADYNVCDLNVTGSEAVAAFHVENEGERLLASLIVTDDEKNSSIITKIFDGSEETDFSLKTNLESKEGISIKAMLWDKYMKPLMYDKTIVYEKNDGAGFIPMSDVTLNDGMFDTSQELGLEYILKMDVDRLLAPSFEMAGLPTPNGAVRYGGWEMKAVTNWGTGRKDTYTLAGHTLGHWMSAAAVFYASTGNAEVKEMLDYTVDKLKYIQDTAKTGYIGGIPVAAFESLFNGNGKNLDNKASNFWMKDYWVPWYNLHKTYQGLIDAYKYTQNTQALNVCVNFANWAMDGLNKLSDADVQWMLNEEYGGMNDVFAQLHEITGREEYLVTARRFTHDFLMNPLINSQDALATLHANTQIPKVIGAAEIFEQNSEKYQSYGKAAKYFWDRVVNHRSYVIGGNSVSEHFETIGHEQLYHKTAESCNTYNMLKLTEHLFGWEHSSEYMDYYEKALYNHVLGSQDPLTGNKMYFVSLLQGHYRIYGTPFESFWCCTGTGMENPGRYSKCIYYKDNNDFYVNLYIPSTVKWADKGLTFVQETNYPYEDTIRFTVTDGEADATLKFRVPSWATQGATATFKGQTYTKEDAGYLEIDGSFKKGDAIEITIPMELGKYVSREGETRVAFTYGPVVLAAPLGTENFPNDTVVWESYLDTTTTDVPYIIYKGKDISELITMVDRGGIVFEINGKYTSTGENVRLKPFYEIHHEFHNVYWNFNDSGNMLEEFRKKLNNVTIDQVQPDGQQDEIGHNWQLNSSNNGTHVLNGVTYMWRDAWGTSDAYFAYNLRTDKDNNNYLCVAYFGDDAPFGEYRRDFSIYVNEVKIAEQVINRNKPGDLYYCFYEIPTSLTAGKDFVTVKWQANGANCCAGGVVEARIVSEIVER